MHIFDTEDPSLKNRSGAVVHVLSSRTHGRVHRVRFPDGFETEVFDAELVTVPTPEYRDAL